MQTIIDLHLFIGLEVDTSLHSAIMIVNPTLHDLITQGGESYLNYCTYLDKRYLGRWVGESIDLNSLELAEKNIYSLLNRLLPDYLITQYEMVLIALPNPNKE